jgi:hypothetical protein
MGAHQQSLNESSALAHGIERFSAWRESVALALGEFATWLQETAREDATNLRALKTMQERLDTDYLTLAFVAEFSRGKSELINALFFGDFDERIVPSGAGRTTMCPTEFLWDGKQVPSIRLLPIETRRKEVTVSDLKKQPQLWHQFEFDPTESSSIKQAIAKVCETRLVPFEEAHALGLPALDNNNKSNLQVAEIPRWRHAIVNYPHPLFLQGLRIIDTPGLNAIGAEPELTHSMLPSAHGVVFLLAADTGVTVSDLEIWKSHIQTSQLRCVVLNKIDGLWDGLRSDATIQTEIARQIASVANHLSVPVEQVFALSAQKALAARVKGLPEQLKRSNIEHFERKLANDLLPIRYDLIGKQINQDFGQVFQSVRWKLTENQRLLSDQEFELTSLRGKNRHAIAHAAKKIKLEKEGFEAGLRLMQGLRSVHKKQTQKLLSSLGMDNLKRHVRQARDGMQASSFSPTLQSAMRQMIESAHGDMAAAEKELTDLGQMMKVMYQQFNDQFGMRLPAPANFTLKPKMEQIEQIMGLFNNQFGLLSLLTHEKWILTRKFFESIALELKKVYVAAVVETGTWLRSLLDPIESQLSAQQAQLKNRMTSVKRVLEASDSLEASIKTLGDDQAVLESQLAHIARLSAQIHSKLTARELH